VSDERTLQVEVVTPDGQVYAGDVAMVVLPGVDGELGILPRHQPLVTLLAIGETRIRTVAGDWDYIATGIGYAEVLFDRVLVVVDHGGGLSTAYAHNSSFASSVGQSVAAGQVISYSGSTGNSSGPHVHFEVRVNGSAVDPLGYL